MKNYKVKVLRFFRDKQDKVERKVGDEFETTKERYEFLKSNNAVELVEIIGEEFVEDFDNRDFEIEQEWNEKDNLVEEIIVKKKRASKKSKKK